MAMKDPDIDTGVLGRLTLSRLFEDILSKRLEGGGPKLNEEGESNFGIAELLLLVGGTSL